VTEARDAFFAAIRGGEEERVRELLAATPALVGEHDPGSFGATPLNVAAGCGDRAMVELLLDAGADPDATSDWGPGGFRPLDSADPELSRFLLSRGATLTAHAAARLGLVDELRRLVEDEPAVVHERGGDGQLPLHFASSVEIVDLLLDAGAEVDVRDVDHEGTAAQYHVLDDAILRRLVERGAAVDVFMAIVLDDLPRVRELLDADPDALARRTDEPGNPLIPHAPGWHIYTYNLGFVRPFQVAVDLGRDAIYDELFDRSPPRLRLLAAAWKGDVDTARRLAAAHPDELAELKGSEALLLCDAARRRRLDAARALLELGFDVDVADDQGFTPAGWAALQGYDDVLELLLRHGPDLERRNAYGGTALGGCFWGSVNARGEGASHARCVRLLAEAGAELPDRRYGSPEVRDVLGELGVPDEP
jgi:ankyrin repeat protein